MEERKNFEQKSNWTDKDWKWLMGILIGIIILILSLWFADYKGIEANFSIMSSAVSIALGLVAIYIALKQDSDSQRLNQQMQDTLRTMENKIDQVDQKVNRLDSMDIEKTIEDNFIPVIEKLTVAFNDKNQNISKQDIQQVFEDAVPYVASNISKQLNGGVYTEKNRELPGMYVVDSDIRIVNLSESIYELLKNSNEWLSIYDVRASIQEGEKVEFSLATVRRALNKLSVENKVNLKMNKEGILYKFL
ncbi:hypothetical protein ICW_01911 [Bacillus wiedmannii]|uniref:hypothetical protein n=1 Tax=Bacillus wiedmannii TaxID=1890302 RepID=UPI00027AA57F|nr:hypothetical protein [Bacillus wiedmannii]EJS70442.1 hypothetical protein ICW_01911 [Bacillus wiedmannii]